MSSVRAASPGVVFVAVPDFYAEVERRRRSARKDLPILIGGDPAKRGKVQSADRNAREYGIRIGMPMSEAMALCPSAISCRTDMKIYREVSGIFVSSLRQHFPSLEIGGLGEVFSELPRRNLDGFEFGEKILIQAQEEMSLPLRMGIAPSKLIARLAAEDAAQGSVRCLAQDDVEEFLGPLSLSHLPRVGEKTALRLAQLGASTVSQLLALDPQVIEDELGNHGLVILEMARGEDRSVIRAARFPTSITREETLAEPGAAQEEWHACLARLSDTIQTSLSRQGLRAGRIAVGVRLDDEARRTRSQTLPEPLERASDLYEAAKDLLARCELPEEAWVRSLRIVVGGLEATAGASNQQMDLFAGPSGG